MSNRSQLQAKILEKLGTPLVRAASDVSQNSSDGQESQKIEAERTAELLAKTLQLSEAMARTIDFKESGSDSDSARLLLAITAGALISSRYRKSAKIPSDVDIQKLTTSMDAVLTFADNFTASAESIARIDQLESGTVIADETQLTVQYIKALIPLVSVVAGFSFGRPEKILVQEATGRLLSRAESIVKNLRPSMTGLEARIDELSVLRGLVDLYVQAHESETARLMAMGDQARAQAAQDSGGVFSMDSVWGAFELRANLAETLSDHLTPKSAVASNNQAHKTLEQSPSEPALEKRPPEPAAQTDNGQAQPDTINPEPVVSAEQTPSQGSVQEKPLPQDNKVSSADQKEAPASPMSFFKSPPKTESSDDDEQKQA